MYLSDFDKAEIRQTVEKQLQAFQRDDFIAAFSFASPKIREQFASWENFQQMVTLHYEAVYRPRSVMFRGLTTINNFPAQNLIVMDSSGNLVQATYVMQQQPDYTWRIHGCFLAPVDKTVG